MENVIWLEIQPNSKRDSRKPDNVVLEDPSSQHWFLKGKMEDVQCHIPFTPIILRIK